ncbi:diaminopimelate decarboxylase [Flexibacterium corallicola]|uniref:diaminopimelate decarboxylase n=1 Tax=Flexibacterium corallicola TaxID=3037259 RepID=UPI00286EFC5E|nr:diaminopimelate decarboxylase [Pseudovibrio sp. M1P-2-3]
MTRSEILTSDLLSAVQKSEQKVKTPFWLYEADPIRKRVQQLKAFDCIRYAQKANSNVHILKILRAEGVRVDAVSLGEIERALRAGFVPGTKDEEIVFTADIINDETLARVVELGIPVNCGSLDMLEQLGTASKGHPVWLRLNPGFGHGHSRKTNTGGPFSKHGIWYEELEEAVALVKKHGLDLVGLHMHIGSGVDYSHLQRVGDSMVAFVKQLSHPIRAISTGGGLSVPYKSGETEVDAQHYFDIWQETRQRIEELQGVQVRLEIEPGRYLVGNAGILVAKVYAVKKVADKHFVLLDAGFTDLARPAMYGSYHEIDFVKANGEEVTDPLTEFAIGGPLCESGDVFTQQEGGVVEFRCLPLPQVGDLAILRDAGAYGATMSSNYNSRPLIPEVLLDNGQLRTIRNRQTIEQLMDLEVQSEVF